ncbi:MAG: monofunctional biosynthetic peptidoglycan transglycosylase [Paludibacter sp.]|nr:monofunctional biosynthetic peptidoglycan transglycosylase [Paludibacter sp.]
MKTKSKNKSFFSRLGRLVRNLVILFFAISIGWVVLARFVPVYVTPLMFIRTVEALAAGEAPRNTKDWVSIDKISHNMVQAVVASEDNLFMQHHGFSVTDIEKAIKHNKKGKRIRGGSTISQQTAKNVFLWPKRSYLRKGLEAYFTVLIELFWSKERIMEVYLNVIEMGDGVYGVQAAAQTYFNKDALQLTKSQSALIAACLPNPRKYSASNPSSYIQRRKSKIVSLMGKIEQVDFDNKKLTEEKKRKRSKK